MKSIHGKSIFLFVGLLSLSIRSYAQGVGISEISITPDASSILELRSTLRGFLPPRMTTGERDLIGTPATGLFLYNTTTNRFNFRNGTWIEFVSGSDHLGVFASTTSAQLATVLSDETGSGLAVFATSPTLTTPNIGVATATSVNKVAVTAPATSATLTLADGSSLVTSGANSITLTSSSATNVTLPTSGTLYGTAASSITSAQLLGSVSDETGTGLAVFATGPAFTGFSSTGATVDINVNSNFATNINTGTSTGAVSIGNSLSTSLTLESGTGGITLGNSANARTWNVGVGNAIQTVNMFNNAAPANTISIGGAASSLTIGARENTIGVPYVANGDGIRFGTNRITKNYPTAPTTGLTANTVATVAQILNAGYIGFGVLAGNRTLTLPTAQGATGLVQNLPGTPAVGDVFTFMVANGATTVTRLVTLVAGTGITLTTHAVAGLTTKVFFCRVTSVTPGAETITVY